MVQAASAGLGGGSKLDDGERMCENSKAIVFGVVSVKEFSYVCKENPTYQLWANYPA